MDPIEAIRTYFESQNEGDWPRLRKLFTEDVEFVVIPYGMTVEGAAKVMYGSRMQKGELPDVRTEITDLFVCGDRGVAQTMTTYTHTSPWITGIEGIGIVEVTGRRVERPGCFVFTFREGKMSRIVHYNDRLTSIQQLGVAIARVEGT